MDDSLAMNDVSIDHGQLQIIFKSELYSFTGKYALVDDDPTILSRNRLQFDYLVLVNGHNLAIHQKDLHKIEALTHHDALQRYVKFEVRLVTADGFIKILTAEGKIFDVYKKTAAEWRRSEQALNHANDLLQTVFDASPHAISVYRILRNRKGEPEDFEILSINTPTVLTIGMRVDELVGQRFGKLFPYMKENGVYDHFREVATTGKRADFETSFDDHGSVLHLRFIVVRSGNLLVATIEDVTSRTQTVHQCFELLRQTEEMAQTGSWDYDLNNNHFYWSDGMYRIFDIPQGTAVRPDVYLDYSLPEDRSIAEQLVNAIQATPGSIHTTLRVVVNGKTKTLKIKSTVQTESDGRPAHVIGIDADVTAVIDSEKELLSVKEQLVADLTRSRHSLVLLNESLNKKNRDLRIMNEELTNFTFIASHDLREPLRKIQLFCSQLAQPQTAPITPEGRALIDKIQNSTQWLNDLIDDILNFSQTASAPRTTHTRIRLNDLLRQVLDELSDIISQTQARVETAPLAELWGNPIQLSQLLRNLISNAIKFQPKNHTPVVSISGTIIPGQQIDSDLAHPGTRYYRLEVKDNGIGFDPQYADRIFRIFQRLNPKEAYPGTGMGLAICKKIAENHNGFIQAKSTPGVGSVFCCYFPV